MPINSLELLNRVNLPRTNIRASYSPAVTFSKYIKKGCILEGVNGTKILSQIGTQLDKTAEYVVSMINNDEIAVKLEEVNKNYVKTIKELVYSSTGSKIMISEKIERLFNEAKIDEFLAKSTLSDEDKAKVKELNEQLTNKIKYVTYLSKNIGTDNIVELINFFDSVVNKLTEKDIMKYTPEQLADLESEGVESKTERKHERSKGAEVVYEDDRFTVVMPRNARAAHHYGTNTEWCIARAGNSHFAGYVKRGLMFYYITDHSLPITDPEYLVCIVMGKNGIDTVWDTPNSNIDPKAYLKKIGLDPKIFAFDPIELKVIDMLFKFVINNDGTVDVDGDVDISYMDLTNLEIEVSDNDSRLPDSLRKKK